MDRTDYLNDINRRFYETTAAAFSETRARPWPGWEKLLPHLPSTRPLRVLDVGCGNGRLGAYLMAQRTITYHGIDNNATLLAHARDAVPGGTVERRDIVANPPTDGTYDLIGVFGVVHHIPGAQNRRALLKTLAGLLNDGGVLAFACWRFMDDDRLAARVAQWPAEVPREDGDYLLDWRRGDHALRYCHFVDDAEHAALISATGLHEVETYFADGHSNRLNHYSILRTP